MRCVLVSALLSFSFATGVQAANWFDDKKVQCTGPFLVDTSPLLPSSVKPFIAPDKTVRAASFGPNAFYTLRSATAPLAVDKLTLSAGDVTTIQEKIAAGKIKIENAVLLKSGTEKVLDFIPKPTPPVLLGSKIFEYATDWITKNATKQLVDLNVFSVLLEEGATLERQAQFKSTPEGRFAVINDLYFVSVQSHQRAILLSSCVAPVDFAVEEFTTGITSYNKIIRKVGAVWKQWDITDGKYDSWVYRLDNQKVDIFEFTEIEPPPTGDNLLMRIDIAKGVMERKRPEWPDFKVVYEKIKATK